MNHPAQPITLYRFSRSGHSHRAELFLSLLGLPVTPVDVDLAGGQHKTPEYLAMNCFGQVPVIRDGDVTVADSNAILCYLASRYGAEHWLPREPAQAAQVEAVADHCARARFAAMEHLDLVAGVTQPAGNAGRRLDLVLEVGNSHGVYDMGDANRPRS